MPDVRKLLPILLVLIALAGAAAARTAESEYELESLIARLNRTSLAWSPTFSADGTKIAFISMLSGQAQVWMVDADGGWPIQLTGEPDGAMDVHWSPTNDLLAYSVPPKGAGNHQIYLIEPRSGANGKRATLGGAETNWFGTWSPDGKHILIASNRRDPEHMDGYLYTVEAGELRLLTENRGMALITDVTPSLRFAVEYSSTERTQDNYFWVDLETGERKALIPSDRALQMGGGLISPDGRYVYLLTDKDRELLGLDRVAISEDGIPGPLETIAARKGSNLTRFQMTRDGKVGALVWNTAGFNELTLLDLASLDELPVPELPTELIGDIAFSPDGRRLAMVLTGATSPRNIWILDTPSQTLRQLTFMPHPGIDLDLMVKPELVRFPSHDGLEISGWLYRARGVKQPGPVTLSMHGGPELQENPNFSSFYQAILLRGISIFAPNVRGSSGFGKKFVDLDNGPLRLDAIADIKACVDYLVAEGIADPDRVGIFGGSYGGYAAMAALTEYPDLFAVAASISGIVDFETFFANTEPWIAAVSKVEYGDPDTQRDLLRRLSPIHRIDRLKAPMVVVHGANDDNVPVSQAEQVVESLRRRGIPVEYLRFEDEGHGIRLESNRIKFQVAIIRWFEKYLKDPAPDQAAGIPDVH